MYRLSAIPRRYEHRSRTELIAKGAAEELLSLVWRRGGTGRRFVLFAQGRAGTTLLTSMLDSHPDIACPDEILRRPKWDGVRYMRRYAERPRAEPVFGFHVKPQQLSRFAAMDDPTDWLAGLEAAGWLILHLRRRDVVAQVFSTLIAKRTGRYHDTAERTEPVRLSADTGKVVRLVNAALHWAAVEDRALAARDPISLTYEDDLLPPDRRDAALGRILDRLDLPLGDLSSPLRKPSFRSPWDPIENADAVRAALLDAGHEALVRLSEDRPYLTALSLE